MRIKFKDKKMQREFLKRVIYVLGAPSLRELSRRTNVNYSTFKNYYTGDRLMSKELYESLYKISRVKFKIVEISENWGQVKGGKIGKRKNGPARS